MLACYLATLKLCGSAAANAWADQPAELHRRYAGLIIDEMYCHLIVNLLFTEAVINTTLLLL